MAFCRRTLIQVLQRGNVADAELIEFALVGRALDIEHPCVAALNVERLYLRRDLVLRRVFELECHISCHLISYTEVLRTRGRPIGGEAKFRHRETLKRQQEAGTGRKILQKIFDEVSSDIS
jgi:hypothetical protein